MSHGSNTSSAITAVLDANVLYPAALRDVLLRCAEHGLFRPRWSSLILEEVARNLVADGRSTEPRTRRMIANVRQYFPGAEVAVAHELIATMPNVVDDDDRHVIAAAVVAGAAVIVTDNLRDFPEHALLPYGVEALSPDEFLEQLLDAAPSLINQILQKQAADLRNPPLTVADILAQIELQAPRFTARVREYLL